MTNESHLATAHRTIRSHEGMDVSEGERIFGPRFTDADLATIHKDLHETGKADHEYEENPSPSSH